VLLAGGFLWLAVGRDPRPTAPQAPPDEPAPPAAAVVAVRADPERDQGPTNRLPSLAEKKGG
jgi:hypothetical protein